VRRRVRLIIVAVIVTLVLVLGYFYLRCSLRRAPEAALKLDLFTIRIAIENYTLDKDRGPKSVQDLVSGHYLKEIPIDPFTHKKDWVPDITDPDLRTDQTVTEIASVHSASERLGCNGIAYNSW
jgi:general secretion pathway protein G